MRFTKKFIVLAVAGLVSGGAFAQSNVTIYGIMDASVFGWSGNGESSTGISSSNYSTSRLGFKGEEALGNGLKAIFNLETQLTLDDKVAWTSGRQANVGLAGNFGKIVVGTMGTMSDSWTFGLTSPMGNMSARNLIGNTLGRFSSEKATGVHYYSPVFSGLQLGAIYGTKQDTDTYSLGKQYYLQVGAKYDNGPFAGVLTFARLSDDADAAKDLTVGATYDFKVVKFYAGYERSADVGTSGSTTLKGTRTETNAQWTVGARVPVGKAGAIIGSYAVNKNDADDTDVKGWQLGYDHKLSKRTTLYANYMRISNDDGAAVRPNDRWVDTPESGGFSKGYGESYNGVAVGIRHMF